MTTTQSLTTDQAAGIIGIDKRTLDNWRSQGRGPTYIKLSKRAVRYTLEDILSFMDQKRIKPVNN